MVAHTFRKGGHQMLGETINFHRRTKALSIKELASRVGVSEGTVRSWESGKRTPKLDNVRKIAEVLKIRVEELTRLM